MSAAEAGTSKAESKDNVAEFFNKKKGGSKSEKELYDSLSQTSQDQWDEIGKLGYRVDKVKSGYIASKISGEGRVGPCESLVVLYNEVKVVAAGEKSQDTGDGATDIQMLDEDGNVLFEGTADDMEAAAADLPSTRLPGMEEPTLEILDKQADVCIEYFEKKKDAATASKDQDDIMRQMMHDNGRKRYSRHGWSIVIEDTEKLVIKKAEAAPPKNPKKDKNA